MKTEMYALTDLTKNEYSLNDSTAVSGFLCLFCWLNNFFGCWRVFQTWTTKNKCSLSPHISDLYIVGSFSSFYLLLSDGEKNNMINYHGDLINKSNIWIFRLSLAASEWPFDVSNSASWCFLQKFSIWLVLCLDFFSFSYFLTLIFNVSHF